MSHADTPSEKDRLESPVEHLCVKMRWVRGLRSDCERGPHAVNLQKGRKQT